MFNMVWVYDMSIVEKLDTDNPEITDSKKQVSDQYSVKVGYTGNNIYPKTESGSDWWPSYNKIGGVNYYTYSPWIYYKDVTTQAWYWNDELTSIPDNPSLITKSPTRTESYVGGDNVANFARGAGDNDGRCMP